MTSETRDVCMMCGCKEPPDGWHISGCSDGDVEHFCSAKCFNENCDYHDDSDDEQNLEEDCGRWSNGRLSLQCSKAGSEECDWICPIGLPERVKRPNKRQGAIDLQDDTAIPSHQRSPAGD